MGNGGYKTRQREAILDYLIDHKDSHVTVNSISDHLEKDGVRVGVTTIYRHLDKLLEVEGDVRILAGHAGAIDGNHREAGGAVPPGGFTEINQIVVNDDFRVGIDIRALLPAGIDGGVGVKRLIEVE